MSELAKEKVTISGGSSGSEIGLRSLGFTSIVSELPHEVDDDGDVHAELERRGQC